MNIFFDLDGVLVDPYPRCYKIHLFLADKYSFEALGYQDYIKSKQNRKPDFYYIDHPSTEKCLKERLLLLENPTFIKEDVLYPEVKNTLEILKKQNNLYLVTVRKDRQVLFEQLNNLEILSYFDTIYSPSEKELGKNPDEMKIELLSPFFNNPKNKSQLSLIIGDTEADILTGQYFGIKTVGVLNGLRTEEFIRKLNPDFVIESVKFLSNILENSF